VTAAPVFVDRDGTLIVEKHYLGDPAQVCLEDGVVAGLSLLRQGGHPVIVLSNQSGIGRGMFTLADARRVNDRAAQLLREQGIDILGWYICPHAPQDMCRCRKPSPGMALDAARELNLTLAGSYVIGDKRADLELADAIGGTGILVTTGQGGAAAAWAAANSRPVVNNMLEAARCIAQRESAGPGGEARARPPIDESR
jgi:histidinol-phosphate phosphatase family protein